MPLMLDGPYCQDEAMDSSYSNKISGKTKQHKMLQDMESAQKLQTLKAQYTKMWDAEYSQLDDITSWRTNTNVPGLNTIDASYIKTPYCEELPAPAKAAGPHFGLMIACDGYSMGRGLLEFWQMVVRENVTVITSFNESFKRHGGSWFEVFQYFPLDTELKFSIKNTYSIKAISKTKTNGTFTRILSIRDFETYEELHQVKHIHFKVWDDFDVPSEENTPELMAVLQEQADLIMEQVEGMKKGLVANPQKVLMHCLAGRGRTGTALAILNAMITIQGQLKASADLSQAKLSVFSIVRRLREQRATAV